MERGGELEYEVGGDELRCGAERGDELRRLEAFEAFAASVREDLADASARMDGLRAAGKVKSATYRQLFAIRSTLREIDRRLRDCGL